jgi:DNA polymerase III delta prime subunit
MNSPAQTASADQQPENVTGPAANPVDPDYQRSLEYAEQILDGDVQYVNQLINHYLHNFMKYTSHISSAAYYLCCVAEGAGFIDYPEDYKGNKFPIKQKPGKSYYTVDALMNGRTVLQEDWDLLKAHFSGFDKHTDLSKTDVTYKNLIRVEEMLGLEEAEKKVLELLYVGQCNPSLFKIITNVFGNDIQKTGIGMARMLDCPTEGRAFAQVISKTSRLEQFGLTYFDTDPDEPNDPPKFRFGILDEDFVGKLCQLDMSDDDVAAILLGKPCKAELKIEDFSHIGEPLDITLKLIKKAVESGEKGINVLIYGPPGSGKTKLAEAIADHLKLRLFSVGEPGNETGFEDGRIFFQGNGTERSADRVRISQLQRTQSLLADARDSIILFDEIEDLLIKGEDASKNADTQNKLLVNRLLENNPVVTIWTGNNPEKFQEYVRQRFAYSIVMDYQPTLIREKIWNRRLQISNVTLPAEDVRDLARDYSAPPRMIAHAVETMRIVGGGIDTIRESLSAASKMAYGQSGAIVIDDRIPKGFELDLMEAEQENMPALFNRLVSRGVEKKPFSLLMQTSPNMGSDHVLNLMAEQMAMNPIEVNASDLVSVRDNQPLPASKILSVFEQATDSRQFLIINNLHNMVENYKQENGWDSPLVDLLTQQALKHKLPFAVTVSPEAKLPSTVRLAFSDTLKINPICNNKAATLYGKVFGQELPEELSAKLQGLASEDFLKTQNMLARMDMPTANFDHGRVVELLLRFKEARSAKQQQRIGF